MFGQRQGKRTDRPFPSAVLLDHIPGIHVIDMLGQRPCEIVGGVVVAAEHNVALK